MSILVSTRAFRVMVLALGVFAGAASVNAQEIVNNPRTVAFSPPDDYSSITNGQAAVTECDLEVFQVGSARPFAVVNLGKPAPAADGDIYVDFLGLLPSPPPTGVLLEARVALVGPAGRRDSAASNLFQFDGNWAPQTAPASKAVSLSITQPTDGTATHVGATITIAAAVNGSVNGVDFYANGRPIGTAASSPYRVKWTGKTAGKYIITAVTIDKNGVQAASAPVVVILGRVPPPKSVPDGKATGRR